MCRKFVNVEVMIMTTMMIIQEVTSFTSFKSDFSKKYGWYTFIVIDHVDSTKFALYNLNKVFRLDGSGSVSNIGNVSFNVTESSSSQNKSDRSQQMNSTSSILHIHNSFGSKFIFLFWIGRFNSIECWSEIPFTSRAL